ncbi:MotA/TolQ/ExbB proton channel [Desulforamulus reducens MI-1]|uniref:MotA/TolQ/ExbB proton channel n=1 Tax=Desulforamulus reducens (strain ATCC BAA-1160 / DSM 100696 / MI-1) TaxID=349161 RepID=A4J7A0_DESRM|nr:flagellar motor protein [Desulforamulus reducens]ABO50953.1 MotA/TolQ/ExbB proton channel [Desulforamulus reducens MI-1]
MEIMTPAGILFAAVCLISGFLLEGGHVSALLAPTAFIIVVGGTLGATVVAFSTKEVLSVPILLKTAMTKKVPDFSETINLIVELAEKARREGLLYLDSQLDTIEDPFLRKAMQLVVDGTDPEMVRSILETEVYSAYERHQVGVHIFEGAGGYAPTMGIIGTVMGLVHVLGNLSDPDSLGPAIAMAFIATLYGVGSANVFWLPIGAKLKNLSKKELVLREMMIEGILALQAGYNPTIIRERLNAFIKPGESKQPQADEGEV